MSKRYLSIVHWLLSLVLLTGAAIIPFSVQAYAAPSSDGLYEVPASGGFKIPADGKFDEAYYVATDSEGNVYVTDSQNNRVQKFDSNGQFIAAWGSLGDGEGKFDFPQGIEVDGDGIVYVVDSYNCRIQKLDGSDGRYLGQWGSCGDGDGQFNMPGGIAVDGNGNVYVADSANQRIQKFHSNGEFIMKWGSQGEGDDQLHNPTGIAVDSSGDYVYVTDQINHRVVKFTSEGVFSGKWGTFGDANGQFKFPSDVAIDDAGYLYVIDTNNRLVQKFDADGDFIGKWGSYGREDGQFLFSRGIAVDHHGHIYTADVSANRIQKFDADGTYLMQWGSYGSANQSIMSMGVDSNGNVYVFDANANKIRKFDDNGSLLLEWGGTGDGEGDEEIGRIAGMATGQNGIIYVLDNENCRIQTFNASGDYINGWGSCGVGAGHLDDPLAITIDGHGFVYVTDQYNYRLQKFNANGEYVTGWEIGNSDWDSEDNHVDLTTDADGHVYVLYASGNMIQKFDAEGNVLLEWGEYGNADGQFSYPTGIAVDASGNVYVADTDNNRIQKFNSNGEFIAQWGGGSDDVSLYYPSGITIGANGLLYVWEGSFVTVGIRKFSPNNNANTADIMLSDGTLSPAFSSANTGPYTVTVSSSVYELTLTPLPGDPRATVQVTVPSGTVTSSTYGGVTSYTVPLNSAATPITVAITAADETTVNAYEVLALWNNEHAQLAGFEADSDTLSLSPAFSPKVYAYSMDVDNSITSVDFALYKQDPTQAIAATGAVPGTVTGSVYTYTASLSVGVNPIAFTVTASDRTSSVYSVNVTRGEAPDGEDNGEVDNGGEDNGGGDLDTVNNAPSATSTNGQITLPPGQEGEVSLGDEVAISIPAGATNEELRLIIKKLFNSQGLLEHRELPLSPIYELTKNFSDNFTAPITLTFAFDSTGISSGQRAGVFYYDEVKKVWVEVPDAKVNGDRITVQVDHFTKFAVMAAAGETDAPASSEPEISLSDIVGHWAKASIEQAIREGIVTGYMDGKFKPDAVVTRAEFTVMLAKAMKLQEIADDPVFKDAVKIGAWAKKAIAQAVQAGIVSGYQDGTFRPDASITRAEMAVMIANALGLTSTEKALTGFADDKDIPVWASGSAAALRNLGLIHGKGNNKFAPNEGATRAEAVTILINLTHRGASSQ